MPAPEGVDTAVAGAHQKTSVLECLTKVSRYYVLKVPLRFTGSPQLSAALTVPATKSCKNGWCIVVEMAYLNEGGSARLVRPLTYCAYHKGGVTNHVVNMLHRRGSALRS